MNTKVFDRKVKARNRAQGRKNFVSGMAFEFVVLKRERRKALFAIRSAGSHTLIDIIAVRESETRLISIRKNGTWLEQELVDLLKLQEEVLEGHNVYLAYKDKGTKQFRMERIKDIE